MKQLKEGITTGSCATGATLASALWQMTGTCPKEVEIDTPIGRILRIPVYETEQYGKCYVIKDAGDDPDVTHGCHVEALVDHVLWRCGDRHCHRRRSKNSSWRTSD